MKINEGLLTTCQTSLQWSACLWDHNNGNVLQIYRNGGSASQKTLAQIGNDYILFAEQNKPLLHVWPVNSQEQIKNVRFILPEPANVLEVCPNGIYLAVGIGLKLYIWQLTSGKLLSVQQKHFQPITSIKFASTCEFLAVGGQDGMLVVYNFGDLVSLQTNYLPQTEMGQVQPLFTKMDHSMAITDMYVGSFGAKSRLATVSGDHNCRIYDLYSGELLENIIFGESLTTVIFDQTFVNLYVGTNSGTIVKFNLKNPPRSIELHIDEEEKKKHSLVGHTKKVTCMSLSFSDQYLASGSDDLKVLIWDTKKCSTLKTIEHKEPVTNVRFVLNHKNFFSQSFNPSFCLKSLERNINMDAQNYTISVIQHEDIVFEDTQYVAEETQSETTPSEQNDLKIINRQLYMHLKEMTNKMHNVSQ